MGLVWWVSLSILPLSLAISVLGYRLWPGCSPSVLLSGLAAGAHRVCGNGRHLRRRGELAARNSAHEHRARLLPRLAERAHEGLERAVRHVGLGVARTDRVHGHALPRRLRRERRVHEDAEAYAGYGHAMKMPRDTEVARYQ